jgi:hypothetical protein
MQEDHDDPIPSTSKRSAWNKEQSHRSGQSTRTEEILSAAPP